MKVLSPKYILMMEMLEGKQRREIRRKLRRAGGENVLVYFCMENPHVWETVLGRAPKNNAELGKWLDESR